MKSHKLIPLFFSSRAPSCIKQAVCYANCIKCSVVYHVQKKYKKRFFVNNKKYFTYLSVVSLLCTYHNLMTIEKKAEQSSTQTTHITPNMSIETAEIGVQESVTPKKRSGVFNRMMPGPYCPHQSVPIRKMTLKHLNDIYEYSEHHKVDINVLTNVLERLISLSDNHAGVKKYKLQYADSHFAMNHLEIAATYYEDFATLYPSSNEAIYAAFKSIGCMFQLSLSPDRDQTNTKKTIALAKTFLKEHPGHELNAEVEEIIATCYTRLFDHEVYVFNYYVKRKKFPSARLRLDFFSKTFEGLIDNLEVKVQALTKQLELAITPVKVDKKTYVHKFLG
ncbi:hypothetical protein C0J27_02900 [Candidatus Chromulinivorax destructor]|uniref:Outer membrane lipoprotein BamD-like domain-containing protein n=1 Tax=Candidatus Chromulinivorax destructor TaxID=2066483 RepID=A0A345ZBL1_9BACT|nr:hypothetical protein C0J27_02900 [Candidatus Chromulinivorax destructor]